MIREILFRGFHEEENGSTTIYVDGRTVAGHWVKGWLATVSTRISHINVFESDDGNNIRVTTYPVITSTVGQYTGVNDKSGKKIFEGDRCQLIKGKRCICSDIKFKNGGFYFKENCGEAQMDLNGLEILENCIGYKVVHNGTIFDEETQKCE